MQADKTSDMPFNSTDPDPKSISCLSFDFTAQLLLLLPPLHSPDPAADTSSARVRQMSCLNVNAADAATLTDIDRPLSSGNWFANWKPVFEKLLEMPSQRPECWGHNFLSNRWKQTLGCENSSTRIIHMLPTIHFFTCLVIHKSCMQCQILLGFITWSMLIHMKGIIQIFPPARGWMGSRPLTVKHPLKIQLLRRINRKKSEW